jgi:MFS family permease
MQQPTRSLAALDWLNFFLADVQSGLGPFLAVYLLTSRQWHEAGIGVVMTAAGIATLLAQTPAGALIDATRWKRAMVIGAAALIGVACLVVTLAPSLAIVTAAQIAMGAAAAIFPPAIAAIALGLVGPARFTRRMGRMQAFNHAGNVTAAVLAGIVGTLIAPAAVFWLVFGFAALTIVATLAIDPGAIDHDVARGFRPGESGDGEHPSGLAVLFESRPLLVFAAAIMLFHLANAAMLPLLGQELALHDRADGAFFMSALIVVAQAVMVPMSILVGRRADRWGRKPLFLAGFLALPLRGVLLTLSSDPAYLIAVQILDGVGAGIFGALFPVVVADLTRGTGRYNLAQGAVATLQGIGAAFSTTVAGFIVAGAGYDAAFLALAVIAVLAALLFLLAMPETMPETMPATAEAADLAAR